MSGYFDYISDLLRPLALYNLERGSIVASENLAAGSALDALCDHLDRIFKNTTPDEADDEALRRWESLFPHTPPADAQERRRALCALFSVGDRSFTLEALRRCLEVCGLSVCLTEPGGEQVEISFPEVAGIPDGFDSIVAALALVLPCHLDIIYSFHYITWMLLEQLFASFAQFDASGLSWHALELIWR